MNLSLNETNVLPARNEQLAQIEIAVQAAIFILAVLGNTTVLVMLCVHARKKKLTRMNALILHLCVADLFVAFFNVLPQLIWDVTGIFLGGDVLCRLIKYLQIVALYASSYVLIVTAFDRYIALCHPMISQTWTNAKVHLLVGLAWAISLVLSLPQVLIFSYHEVQPGHYDCWATFDPEWTLQAYVTWFSLAIYIGPTLVLVLVYGRICWVVWRSAKQCSNTLSSTSASPSSRMHLLNVNGQQRHRLSRAKVKTVKLTLAVVSCYFLCWSPFFISQLWAAWDYNAPFQGSAMVIIMLLASLNSCTNPWIYLVFTDSLCERLTHCCRPHRHTPSLHPHLNWSSTYHTKTSSGQQTNYLQMTTVIMESEADVSKADVV